MLPITSFTDPVAVETWDACFRWRDGEALRDVTIDATWWRVAEAVAAVEGAQAPLWAHRFVDAFSHWRLLPDERLLRAIGTRDGLRDLETPSAVVNLGAFVPPSWGTPPRFDGDRLALTAALAVRLLDDAVLACHPSPAATTLRIGVIGLANALDALGLPYYSEAAHQLARTIARTLAEGCLRGSLDLAEERGPLASPSPSPDQVAQWHERGMPRHLVQRAQRIGLRHRALTAIDPHPMLAHLANHVSDAIDPPPAMVAPDMIDAALFAQFKMRSAMQLWIDAAIDYRSRPPRCEPGRPSLVQCRGLQ